MTTEQIGNVEIVSFTAQELDIITDALNCAACSYEELAMRLGRTHVSIADEFNKQSREARGLQLKIEAAR